MTSTEQIKSKLSNSISVKLVVIFLLILLMQIPLSFVRGLIDERQQMQHQAQRDISNRWGGSQYIGSPLLNIYSVNRNILNSHDKATNSNLTRNHSIQATKFDLDVNLNVEKRYLGIYEAAIFTSQVEIKGIIDIPSELAILEGGEIKLFIPIKQIKGLKKLHSIKINNKSVNFSLQQTRMNNLNGFELDLTGFIKQKSLIFELEFLLVGSQQFDVLPLAKESNIKIQSNWNAPSFVGDYLPDERSLSETGFKAHWTINNIIQNIGKNNNTVQTYSNNFIGNQTLPTIGVKVIIPANIYQVNERTVKYSFLIVLLTFAGFFLAELFFKLRLHPFQYLLIGVSLTVFYLLLLSISEYLLFNWAFMIASGSIILLISSYCAVVLQQRSRGVYTGLLFTILYGFIFVLVKAEETSLLMGSIGIWLMLALVMHLTRKIDWYAVNNESR